jgi:MFS family permease
MAGLIPLFILAHFSHHIVGAMLGPLMPFIRDDLHLNYTQVGIITSAFALAGGLSQLPAGYLADRFGQRILITIGIAGVALSAVLIGFSNSYLFLISALIVAAVLGGGYHSSAATVLSNSIPEQYRGRSLGLHLIGGTSSMWIVPLIAAPIAAALGWQASYFILAVPAFLLGVLIYFLLGRLTYTKSAAAAAQAAFTPQIVFNWKKVVPVLVLVIGGNLMTMSVTSYLSLYAVDHLGMTETAAGMLPALIPAIGFIGAPAGGFISDRFGSVPVLLLASFLLIPLLYTMGLVNGIVPILAVLVLIGLVTSVCMPTTESFILGNTPVKRRSTMLGIYFFAGAGTGGLVNPFMGNLIDRLGFQSTYTIASIVVAVILVLFIGFILFTRQLKSVFAR